MVDFVCKESYDLRDFIALIDYLRSPKGCPWDREQTFESLKKCLADETEEVFQAIDNKDMENLCEELGDVLLQVILNSQIAKEEGVAYSAVDNSIATALKNLRKFLI